MPPPGRPDACTVLYERHWQELVAYCRPRLDRPDDAEDAAHEALLRAFRALPHVRDDEPMWPWLATIAANVCTDMRRRSRRLSTADAAGAAADPTTLLAPDVHEAARDRLRADLLHRALRRLPPSARRLLVLREYGGWTYEEIARTEGTSVAAVRSRLMRSRRRLGHRVEELARAERQWPLPVAWLRRRVETAKHWAERALQAVTGLDASVLLTGVGVGAQAAAAVVVAIWLAGGPHRGEPVALRPLTAPGSIEHVSGHPVQVDPARGPRPGAAVGAPAGPLVGTRGRVATIARLDSSETVPRTKGADFGETTAETEDHGDYLEIRLVDTTTVPGFRNEPDPYVSIPCGKNAVWGASCLVVRTVAPPDG